jgi:hypothetical protein
MFNRTRFNRAVFNGRWIYSSSATVNPGPDPYRGTLARIGPDAYRGTLVCTGPDPLRSTMKRA